MNSFGKKNYSLSICLLALALAGIINIHCTQDNTKIMGVLPGKQWPNAFYDAIYNNNLRLVKDMLKKNRELVFSCIENRINPLMVAASQGHDEQAQLFLSLGLDVNNEDDMGRTPLYYAIYNGQVATARLLIKHHAEVDYRSIDNLTPLMYAATIGNLEIVKMLVNHGADVYARGRWDSLDARWWAYKKEHTPIAKYLDTFYK